MIMFVLSNQNTENFFDIIILFLYTSAFVYNADSLFQLSYILSLKKVRIKRTLTAYLLGNPIDEEKYLIKLCNEVQFNSPLLSSARAMYCTSTST